MPSSEAKRSYTPLILGFGGLILLVIVYSVYWFYAASEIEQRAEAELDAYRAQGFDIKHQGLEVSGYPYRFVMDLEKPFLQTPDDTLTWQGESLKLVVQSYNLNHVIGYAPGRQIIENSGETFTTDSEGLQASLSWSDNTIKRLSIVADTLTATTPDKKQYTATKPHIHASPMPADASALRVMLGFEELQVPEAPIGYEWLGTKVGPFSSPIAVKNGIALLRADEDIKAALKTLKPELISPLTSLQWGPAKLKVRTETLGLDELLRPAGVAEARADDIDGLMAAIQKSGKLDIQTSLGLGMAKGMLPEDDSFIPIVFSNGKVRVLSQDIATLEPIIQ